jgi:GntR family transcriptional regulator/MocR family aminotransferase
VHVLLPLADDVDDEAVAQAAAEASISVRPLSPCYLPGARRGSTPARGLLLGYGRLPVTRIDEAVAALAEVIRRVGGNRPATRAIPDR